MVDEMTPVIIHWAGARPLYISEMTRRHDIQEALLFVGITNYYHCLHFMDCAGQCLR